MQNLNTYKKYINPFAPTRDTLGAHPPGTSRNYCRVVHLGWEVHLENQMSAEIKMPKRAPTMQKLNTYKKYSTLSHQPGTPWGHTRDI